MARLGDVFPLIRNGASIKQTDGAGGYPITRIETIANREIDRSKFGYADIEDVEKYQDYLLQDGDILMSHINSEKHLGKVALYHAANEEKIIHGMNLLMLRANRNLIRSDYATYFLNSEAFLRQIPNITKKSVNQASFTVTALKELTIPVPELSEQKEISKNLDKISILIFFRKQQLAKLDELVKARFVELFGDPNLNNKGWEKGVINDIGTCVAGATPSTQVKEYWENGTIPWMSSGEVNKGRVFGTDTKITQLGYDNASTKLVPPKTVVLAMAGQGKTRGTAAITEIELCTNQSICSIVNNEKVNAEYLLHFLKLQYMELRGASTNTDGRGGLNLKIIGNYPIMIPPIELQNQFAAFVEQTDKSKLAIQQSLDKLATLKKSLMQKYFG